LGSVERLDLSLLVQTDNDEVGREVQMRPHLPCKLHPLLTQLLHSTRPVGLGRSSACVPWQFMTTCGTGSPVPSFTLLRLHHLAVGFSNHARDALSEPLGSRGVGPVFYGIVVVHADVFPDSNPSLKMRLEPCEPLKARSNVNCSAQNSTTLR